MRPPTEPTEPPEAFVVDGRRGHLYRYNGRRVDIGTDEADAIVRAVARIPVSTGAGLYWAQPQEDVLVAGLELDEVRRMAREWA